MKIYIKIEGNHSLSFCVCKDKLEYCVIPNLNSTLTQISQKQAS